MSQTEKKLASGHSSTPCSNTLVASTPNTTRPNESDPFNEAVTSAQIANLATTIGRCRCGRDFVATLTYDIIHKTAIEGTMSHLGTMPHSTTFFSSKRQRVNNIVDQIFGTPESRELSLFNIDHKSIIDRSNFVSSPYNASSVRESQRKSNSPKQHRKQRLDQSTNNNLASDTLNTVEQEMNHRVLDGFNIVPLQHGSQQAEQSPFMNCTGNGVPDQPFSSVLERNTSSVLFRTSMLDSLYSENDNVVSNLLNDNLTHNQYFETQKTNRRDNIILHWIDNMRKRGDRGNIPSNDGTKTNYLLSAPVEGTNPKSNKVIPVESIDTQGESAMQIVDVIVQNNNAYQCFGGGYAHHEHSTSSPPNLSCDANPSQYSPGDTSPTKPKKRKKSLSKYLVKWEKEINVRLCWLTKGRKEGNAYCLVCKRDILIKHMGKSAVLVHVEGKQHSSRIALIETNLHLIQSGTLQTHLNMSDYVIPAHENLMSDRTQKTKLAMCEQGKQEQQGDIIQDEGRATNYSDEWTVRCNCGQTEKFFQEILKVSDGK